MQRCIETLDVDGRRIDVWELTTDDEVDGYDIYGADDEGDPLNLGDIFYERPTVESVRDYLAARNCQPRS